MQKLWLIAVLYEAKVYYFYHFVVKVTFQKAEKEAGLPPRMGLISRTAAFTEQTLARTSERHLEGETAAKSESKTFH